MEFKHHGYIAVDIDVAIKSAPKLNWSAEYTRAEVLRSHYVIPISAFSSLATFFMNPHVDHWFLSMVYSLLSNSLFLGIDGITHFLD